MSVETFKGTIKFLGAGVTSVSNNKATNSNVSVSYKEYSHIEMADGTVIRAVSAPIGINGILEAAFEAGEVVEMHCLRVKNSKFLMVVALKRGDGRAYYCDNAVTKPQIWMVPFMIALAIFGVVTMLVFIGFLFLYLDWMMWKMYKMNKEGSADLEKILRGLPNAIAI